MTDTTAGKQESETVADDSGDAAEPDDDGWSRYASRIAVYSPVFAAALTFSFVAIDRRLGNLPLLASAETPVLLLNAALSVGGSAAGGLLVRGPIWKRVSLAAGCGAWGFVAYFALAACIGWTTHRW